MALGMETHGAFKLDEVTIENNDTRPQEATMIDGHDEIAKSSSSGSVKEEDPVESHDEPAHIPKTEPTDILPAPTAERDEELVEVSLSLRACLH
jgi:hypothetical protein